MRRIVLLRHGRTRANDQGLYCGSTDLPLSPGGREELMRLRRAGGYPRPDGFQLVTSGLRRTDETMELLYGPGAYRHVPALREMDFGVFEMRGYETLREDPAYRRWCDGDNRQNRAPGGESGEEMRRRVWEAFRALSAEGDFLAVIHGGPIAAIMEELFPEEGRTRYQWQPGGGRGYELAVDETGKSWYRRIPEGEKYERQDGEAGMGR